MFNRETNKYIFLDIDGVMNCHSDIRIKHAEGVQDRLDYHFCDMAWENLADLCKKTDAKIILSSSWRHGFIKDERGRMVPINDNDPFSIRLLAYFKAHHIQFVDTTTSKFDTRGQQILDYIAENLNGLTDEWIVLDDELFDYEDKLPMDNVFKTSSETGFTREMYHEILEHWGWDEDTYVFFVDDELMSEYINPVYDAAPGGVLVLDGRFGFKENYIDYCREKCFNQDHGAPLYIVTNMPYFLEKAYWNNKTNLFNAYIWSEEDECYHNVQTYTDRELRGGHNLHTLYVNGHLTDHWSEQYDRYILCFS